MAKIVHLSSVHRVNDNRIFHKECKSLADYGYSVTVIGRDSEYLPYDGVKVVEIKTRSNNRFIRMTATVFEVFRKALLEKGDVYHFHDPELIPVGIALKILGYRVIYDVHENVPAQILTKSWIPVSLRKPVSKLVSMVERIGAAAFDGIVCARLDSSYAFPNDKTIIIQNFPRLSEFGRHDDIEYVDRDGTLVYIGGISEPRGIFQMVEALHLLRDHGQIRLSLGGNFTNQSLRREVRRLPGWKYVNELGWLNRDDLVRVMIGSRVGLLLFHDIPNHTQSYPTKLFEYMMAGLPIVASDIHYWRQFVLDLGTGLMVNPLDPQAVAEAVAWLLENPKEAEEMGKRGRKAVITKYNWECEAERLVKFYRTRVFA